MSPGALSPVQRETLEAILHRFAGRYRDALLFGSRATGKARVGSDVDLAIRGADEMLVGELLTDLIESDLSLAVDIVDYDRVGDAALRAAIDRDGVPFFPPDRGPAVWSVA